MMTDAANFTPANFTATNSRASNRLAVVASAHAVLILCLSTLAAQDGKPEPSKKEVVAKKEAAAKKEVADKIYAIVGATVHPVSQPRIRRGTVIWQDGKILAVGSELEIPEGAEVIQAEGKHVSPGFVSITSAGVGLSRTQGNFRNSLDPYQLNLRICLAHGITTVQALGVSAGSGFSPDFPIGTGTGSAIIKMTYGDLKGMMVREPALNYYSLPRRQFELNAYTLREQFKKAAEYLEKLEEAKKKKAKPPKMPSGLSSIVTILKNERPTVIAPRDPKQVELVLELEEEYGFDLVFYEPNEQWPMATEFARRSIPVLVKTRGADFDFNLAGSPLEKGDMIPIRRAAAFQEKGVLVGILPYRRGVSLSGLAGRDLVTLNMDAAFAVRGGMDERQALAGITLSAAKILGIDDRVGSLEPGKDADILLLNTNPLDYRAFVLKAYIGGKEYYDRETSRIFRRVPLPDPKL